MLQWTRKKQKYIPAGEQKNNAFGRKVACLVPSAVICEVSISVILLYLSHGSICMEELALRQRHHQSVLACVTAQRGGAGTQQTGIPQSASAGVRGHADRNLSTPLFNLAPQLSALHLPISLPLPSSLSRLSLPLSVSFIWSTSPRQMEWSGDGSACPIPSSNGSGQPGACSYHRWPMEASGTCTA